MNERHDNHLGDEPDLARLSDALDALGAHERARAPGGLEDRIVMRTQQAAADTGPAVVGRIGVAPFLKIAAAIAMVATLGVVVYVVQRPAGPAPIDGPIVSDDAVETETFDVDAVEAEFDAWLASIEASDDGVQEIATIASGIEEATMDFWNGDFDLGEESM